MPRLGVPLELTRPVSDLIFATRHDSSPADQDATLLVDIDLSILGQPAPVFDDYEAGIRYEYAWVAEAAFRAGRSNVLRSFFDRPRIYATDYFRDIFESAARQNLGRSLAKLSG